MSLLLSRILAQCTNYSALSVIYVPLILINLVQSWLEKQQKKSGEALKLQRAVFFQIYCSSGILAVTIRPNNHALYCPRLIL
jgi:hypothetical protein